MLSRRAHLAATFENAADWELRCLLQRIARTADSFHAALLREVPCVAVAGDRRALGPVDQLLGCVERTNAPGRR